MLEVKYITNDKGERTDVVMPLSDYLEILDEIEKLKVVDKRKGEELFTHSDVEKLLKSDE
ncbi:MAG: hypothetical protein CVV22_12615 [Ignavibacteriae bacterium HGW-Ignavibacteriae-1]|jgi:hypothetical protein|nr:MAG: hypothetical protein CVV22_12615 [Ignavibacteriae bacterium HGW-Ignavibacteriae-1]